MPETRWRSLVCITILWVARSTGATAQAVIDEARSCLPGRASLELRNSGAAAIDLSGWSSDDAVSFTFQSGSWVEAGTSAVVLCDPAPATSATVIDVKTATSGTLSFSKAGAMAGDRSGAFVAESWQELATTTLSLPHNAQGGPAANVGVPISVAPGDGILGIDATITYDAAVLQATSVSTSGIGSTAGFSTFANLNNPGVIVLSSFATSNALSGSGEFARIQFHVIGTPSTTSALGFSSWSVNEGQIVAGVDPGLFTVTCAGVANGTACSDGNVCTVGDSCQSGACVSGTPAPPPAEIIGLAMAPDRSSMSWNPAAGVVYDVARGVVSELPAGGGAGETCVATGTASASASDAATPPPLTSYWYLARGRNSCGIGTYGYAENSGVQGAQRNPSACP